MEKDKEMGRWFWARQKGTDKVFAVRYNGENFDCLRSYDDDQGRKAEVFRANQAYMTRFFVSVRDSGGYVEYLGNYSAEGATNTWADWWGHWAA